MRGGGSLAARAADSAGLSGAKLVGGNAREEERIAKLPPGEQGPERDKMMRRLGLVQDAVEVEEDETWDEWLELQEELYAHV